MRVEIKPATLRDVCFVAGHMRDQDWREVSAIFDETPQALAVLSYSMAPDFVFCAWLDGSPVAAFGIAPQGVPWLWSAWAFGTKRMRRVVPAMSRHIRDWIIPTAIAVGARRVEVRSIIDHDLSHGWLSGLGARREADLPEYGRNGETFVLYAFLKKDLAHVHV